MATVEIFGFIVIGLFIILIALPILSSLIRKEPKDDEKQG